MADTEQLRDDLQAAVSDDAVYIHVTGRGSFKVSAALKQFISGFADNEQISTVVIDLADCVGMDSTFMGVLAGLAGRLKNQNKNFELINVSEKNRQLLETLGVAQVIRHFSSSAGRSVPFENAAPLPSADSTKKELAETALAAHRQLMELGEENQLRFKRVVEYLQTDVDKLNN